ncbi:DNA internalization-related competence protein ComEC/Rec2 [Aminipila luticellarii]|uniref:DNA internalization-related competence protein ComEC/Rec2 n=1 Tax=Aminipila luticellarii TaxID=2507160 RepID=A0A410PVY2_9FIRM|nr:DNA internalization-related competence protein ComEC/Rec2 [Aminipila luticellarii]QAT43036.1 DNA internalization-related competence protein ComEC/Rec2 [Aminipila luticellarii]
MRRPTAFLCGSYILGMAAEFFLKPNPLILCTVAACIAGVGIAALYGYKKGRLRWSKKNFCLYLIAILLSLLGAAQYGWQEQKTGTLEQHQGEFVTLCGKVVSAAEKKEEDHKLTLVVQELEGAGTLKKEERVLVSVYGPCPQYYTFQGQKVQISGFIQLPAPRRNPKTFDYRMYLKTRNISVILAVKPENIQVSNQVYHSYLYGISKIKHTFKANLQSLFDDETTGLLMGLIFGDNGGIDDELYETFQKNGICHVLSVSGLHVGCLYMCIHALFGRKRNRRVYGLIIFVLFFYASLSNFSPTVMRAFFMILLNMLSKYMYCRYDMLTSGAVTMAGMLFVNPMNLLNLGFQLSFLAIFSLAVLTPAAMRIWSKSVAAVLSIQAGMVPVSAYVFNYFSLSSFLVNIPVAFLSGWLIPLGMLLLLFSMLGSLVPDTGLLLEALNALFQITGILTEFFCKLLIFINNIFFINKISYRYMVSPPLWSVFLYYGVLFFISSEIYRILWQRKKYKYIERLLVLVICTALIFGNSLKDGFERVQMTFVDVGQGDCLLIKTPEGKAVLIDSGGSSQYDVGKKTLLPYLLKNGVKKIDLALITHFHTDHAGGLYTLAREIPVKKIGMYEGNQLLADQIEQRTGVSPENFMYLTKGQTFKVGKELEIEVLYPRKQTKEQYVELMGDEKDENASCLVMKVTLEGVSVIMTGDMDTNGERLLLEDSSENELKADILKVAHHGSRYGSSEEFLEAVRPEISVIQVGKNTYGHPHETTVERLESMCKKVYRNDRQGAVGIEIEKGSNIKIHTMI